MKNSLDEILEKLPEEFNMAEIMQKSAVRSPYVLVCFQECERMNVLLGEIRRSLKQLDLSLKVREIQFVLKSEDHNGQNTLNLFFWAHLGRVDIFSCHGSFAVITVL